MGAEGPKWELQAASSKRAWCALECGLNDEKAMEACHDSETLDDEKQY